ncbi:MAG TPA: S8 family serine peptidase [Gemmatimonadaceae bacterium]|nr:S8 family serine peptidase [Gemmatimonadaceae bacterium]
MTHLRFVRPLVGVALALAMLAAVPGAQSPGSGQRPEGKTHSRQQLAARAVANGRVRVIVSLNVAAAPDGQLNASQRGVQRALIAGAQTTVLNGAAGLDVRAVARFRVLPGMALDVDLKALEFLERHPQVASIQEDELAAPTLAQSASLIGAPTVWSTGYTGAGQTVAILDTGVERSHSFFGGRVVAEACYSTTSSGQSTSLCPGGVPSAVGSGAGAPCSMSDCGHGTHVAGIAAGSNGSDVHGVARGANIIAIQVFSRFESSSFCGGLAPCALSYESDQIRGLEFVYELRNSYNIAAANMSLGGGQFSSQNACDTVNTNSGRKPIIDALRSAGIATVISAGNGDRNGGFTAALSSPACISSAVSVGSTMDGSNGAAPTDGVSAFSNSASFLSLLAPGQSINSSIPGGGFSNFQGTSMAAPHVAGAWALLKSRYPGATVSQVLDALSSTGLSVTDSKNGITKKRISVAEAMIALARACVYSLSSTSATVAAAGGLASSTVAAPPGCAWTAVSNDESFITIGSGATGIGRATVTVSVAVNNGASGRSGTVTIAGQNFTVAQAAAAATTTAPGVVDFNADGGVDLLWHHQTTGEIATWLMNGTTMTRGLSFSPGQVSDTNWKVVGAGDLDGDGHADLVWQNIADGRVSAWLMNGLTRRDGALFSIPQVEVDWRIRSVGDLDGDGKADLIWQHQLDGRLAVWLMDGLTVREGTLLNPAQVTDTNWHIVATADFDRDGRRDLLWQHQTDGRVAVWLMNGIYQLDGELTNPSQESDTNWKIRGAGDFNSDGYPDIIWQNIADGQISVWYMRGLNLIDGTLLNPSRVSDTNWRIVGPR